MDLSWLILAALITWSLAAAFHAAAPGFDQAVYWGMGLAGALGLFVSIVFHEMCHSLVARHYGLEMKGITLFVFGGVAELSEEPTEPKVEFLMAMAGPVSSFALAGVLLGSWYVASLADVTWIVLAVLGFLWFINVLLAVFNLITAFPLDGGRVLRSLLWGWKSDLKWATRVSTTIGSGFGLLLILLGVAEILLRKGGEGLVNGMWLILIGWFLRSAARASYQQLMMRQALEGEPVRRFMNPAPVTVPPTISLKQVVEEYVYRYGYAMFPVMQDGELLGAITVGRIKEAPREEWDDLLVNEVMYSPTEENTTHVDQDAVNLLAQMRRTGQTRIMVLDDHQRLAGVITIKDLLKFLSLKVELENTSGPPPIRIPGRPEF